MVARTGLDQVDKQRGELNAKQVARDKVECTLSTIYRRSYHSFQTQMKHPSPATSKMSPQVDERES